LTECAEKGIEVVWEENPAAEIELDSHIDQEFWSRSKTRIGQHSDAGAKV
jgi:hypothetical protein